MKKKKKISLEKKKKKIICINISTFLSENDTYDNPNDNSPNDSRPNLNKKEHLLNLINDNIIGKSNVLYNPFYKKECNPLIYCDYTASGRGLTFY